MGFPAAYPGVVAVSATDDKDQIAWFSSRGPEVTIAAPGVAVTQQTVCNGGKDKCEIFGTFNGTSMASPHVAGVAAMIESLGVTDPDAVREALTSSARPKDDPKLYGAGILDAGAAASRTFYWTPDGARRGAAPAGVAGRTAHPQAGRQDDADARLGRGSPGRQRRAALVRCRLWVWRSTPAGCTRRSSWPFDRSESGIWCSPAPGCTGGFCSPAPFRRWPSPRSRSRANAPGLCIGGLALGSAALLAQMAWSGDAAFVFGPLMARLWAVGNALVCLWIARMALDTRPS